MATPAAVSAILRALKPRVRSRADQAVIGIHALLAAQGFLVVAVGADIDNASAQERIEEVDLEGWNSNQSEYSFLYRSETDPSLRVLVKALVADSTLLVNFLSLHDGAAPQTLDLDINHYTGADPSVLSLQDLPGLVSAVQRALQAALPPEARTTGNQASNSTASGAAAAGTTGGQQGGNKRDAASTSGGDARDSSSSGQDDPLREPDPFPLRGGVPGRHPLRVGGFDEDGGLVMGGPMGMPRLGGMPGGPGGFHPLDGSGGMVVGPNHPFFADRMRHPDIRPGMGGMPGGPGMGPGGMRWDPIAPEGLQGWRPEDFQRGGRGRGEGLNDIGRPPPGRGADWDEMYG